MSFVNSSTTLVATTNMFEISSIIVFIGAQAAFVSSSSVIEKIVSEIFKKETFVITEKTDTTPAIKHLDYVYRSKASDNLRKLVSNFLECKLAVYLGMFTACFLIYMHRSATFNEIAVPTVLIFVALLISALFLLMIFYQRVRKDYTIIVAR